MAVVVQTSSPSGFLAAVKRAIDEGHLRTWSYDADGDFTHTPDQWKYQAWFRPIISSGTLKFGLLGNTNVKTTKGIYGVYHGRFIEGLLTHFDDEMNSIAATPLPEVGIDKIAA